MKTQVLFTFYLLLCFGVVADCFGQIAAWKFEGTNPDGSAIATQTDANIEKAELSRGTGASIWSAATTPVRVSTADLYSAFFPKDMTTKVAAVAANAYYEVVIKVKPDYALKLEGVASRIRRSSASAAMNYQWAYSLDGTNFTDIGTTVTMTTSGGSGADQALIDLSGISALQNVSSSGQVTLRLYVWGATANSTNTGFGSDKTVNSLALNGVVFNTMPVKLTSFKGKAVGNTVKLSWTTASEQNNARFEVLRSSTGKPTAVIGTVNGNNTSNANHHYNFTDSKPLSGTNYYQLRQIDNDGKSESLEIIAVATDLNSAKVTVTATQAEVIAQLYSNVKTSGKLYISDLSGKTLVNTPVVLNENTNNVLTVPFAAAKGVYILRLVTVNGVQLSAKFYK